MAALADIILLHRTKAGLTQAGLARLSGVGKTVIWKVEHGHEAVQWNHLLKLFRVLNIRPEWRSPILDRENATAASADKTVP